MPAVVGSISVIEMDNDSIPMREIVLDEDCAVVDLRYSKNQIELFLYSSIAQLVVALDC